MSPYRASPGFTESWDHFRFEVEDGVATVTFDRPDKLNALTFDVYADLRDLVSEIEHRDDVNVLVLTGTGRGFCSGGDVDEIIGPLLEMDSRGLLEFTRMTGAVVEGLRRPTRDLFLAQRFARHVSPLTTTVYTHPSDEEIKRRLRLLTC